MEYYYLSYFCSEELLHSYLEWFLQIKKLMLSVTNIGVSLNCFQIKTKQERKRKERRKESTIFLSAFHELFVHIVHNLLQN